MKITKLENIVEVSAGQGAPQGDDSYCDNGLPFIKAGNLEDLIITNDEYKSCKLVNRETANKYRLKLYPKDTLVFAKSGMSATKGRIYCLNNEAYVVNHLSTIIPNTKFIETKYLKYYFYVFPPSRLIKDESYPSISLGDIKKIEIPLPSLEDQKHIVKILDKADILRNKRKQAIELLDDYLKSVFLEMFGDPIKNPKRWEIKLLGEVCAQIVDCPHSTPIKSITPTNYACIRTSELKNGYINWDSMQYVTEAEYRKRVSRLVPIKGDIVYGREGTFGEAIIIPNNLLFCLGQRTMLFRPNPILVTSEYLWAIIRSDYVYRQALRMNTGSTVGHVNVKDIKTFNVLLPPLELQNRFAMKINKLEIFKQKMLTQSEELENQFQALIQKAFKGEL